MFVMFNGELFPCSKTVLLLRALVWAGKVWIPCTIYSARMLHNKYLCSRHFLESDFITAERVRFNRLAVPYGSDSASQSLPRPPVPSIHTSSFNPFFSVTSRKDNIHVISPTTYSRTLVPSPVTPIPVHADSPSSFQMFRAQPSPTAANTLE
jgi:hypothetical protein